MNTQRKNRKFLSIFAAVALIAAGTTTLFSCSKSSSIAYSDIPEAPKAVLDTTFPDQEVKTVKSEKDNGVQEYEVVYANGIKVELDENGNWEEVSSNNGTAVPLTLLPANVIEYVTVNYPTSTVVKIEQDKNGYEVKFADGTELEFDVNGNFLKIDK